jgi:CHASE3 domain sensor protein
MAEARQAEKSFLLERDRQYVNMVQQKVAQALEHVAQLAEIDTDNHTIWQQMVQLIRTYKQTFLSISDAWDRKGLDHNSGLL